MAMLVMVQPAQAVDQVDPVSGGWFWNFSGVNHSSPAIACAYGMSASYRDPYYVQVGSPVVRFGSEKYTQRCYRIRISDGVAIDYGLAFADAVEAVCPVAMPAYTMNYATNKCERADAPACPAADTLHSQGFFNLGTTPNGSMPSTPCVNGCALKTTGGVYTPGQNLYLSGSPKFKQIRNGVYYYFAEASYWHTGQACSPDTPNFLADFVGSKPDMTCQAGQQMITMSGVTKCFNSDGSASNPNSASAVAVAKTLADAKTAKAIQDAKDAVAAAGGSASEVAAAGTVAAGVSAAGGSGSSNPDSVDAAFCADNPTAPICVEQDFGSVEDSSLQEKTINVAITPVAVGGAGSCPAPSSMILHGQQYWFQWTTYCNFATGIKPILLAFAWLSAAGLLIGGFKTA